MILLKSKKLSALRWSRAGSFSYFLFTFLPWDAPLGRRRLKGCSLWHRRFFRFCPGSDLESTHQKRQQGGEKPSPSRLRRATSPERERLWQGRKVLRLSADFFLPLTNEDETCRFCQGLSLRESCRAQARLRGFVLEETPSVTLRRATSPEGERLWQGRKVYRLIGWLLLPLTCEDETFPLCQGLPLRGSCRAQRD